VKPYAELTHKQQDIVRREIQKIVEKCGFTGFIGGTPAIDMWWDGFAIENVTRSEITFDNLAALSEAFGTRDINIGIDTGCDSDRSLDVSVIVKDYVLPFDDSIFPPETT
jgi:hypothetical protein